MYNLFIALGVSAGVFFIAEPFVPLWAAVAIGLVVGLAAFVGLSFFTNRRLKDRLAGVETAMMAGQPEQAIEVLEDARELGRWQYGIDQAIDGQIGVILYAQKQDVAAAQPYLEKAIPRNWQAKAMLGAIHFKDKDFDKMESAFDDALRFNKKESLLWSAYAWCQWRRGKRDAALEILERGEKKLPEDEAIQRNLEALRAGKKMRMKAYEPEWWALHLERPPARVMQGGRRRGGRYARRA